MINFKNKNCEIIYRNIVRLVNQLDEIGKLDTDLKDQVLYSTNESLTELEEEIDKGTSLTNAYNVCDRNNIVCITRDNYNAMQDDLLKLRKEFKKDINDHQEDVSKYTEKTMSAKEYYFLPAKNNALKDFQKNLLEMIAIRQQNEVEKLPAHPENYMYLEIGKLKAYKDIFELVLAFYRGEDKNEN